MPLEPSGWASLSTRFGRLHRLTYTAEGPEIFMRTKAAVLVLLLALARCPPSLLLKPLQWRKGRAVTGFSLTGT
ncbi:MAG: hypothetical protein CM15mP79_0420 [Methanobacteriota archaeon]|nr:MAG: hypothetical protein CM15mP79_0420 [Euryarchaeota archaeon]